MKSSLLVRDLIPLEEYARRARGIPRRGDRPSCRPPGAARPQRDAAVRRRVDRSLPDSGGRWRAESISTNEAIQAEIDLYSPRIPDGSNLKASFMLEFSNSEERRAGLQKLAGVESRVWMQVQGSPRVSQS